MINLIEIPQRADYKVEYIINNDILTVKIDETIEPFDFTGLEDGVASEIIAEILPINPVMRAEKTEDLINIIVCKFYSEEEKELFEIV